MTTLQDITSPMTPSERHATLSLAGIYALRMLGLFMILPVLPLFAEQLEGSTPALIGLAMGIYGLPQVLLQIPFGLMSDRYGRKKIIVAGLVMFLLGSVIASLSTTIYGVLIGRAFQGAGAISSAIMALVADLTQEVHRTKAMALIGVSIGLSFGVGIVAGPIVSGFGGVQAVFGLTALLSLLAILAVVVIVPNPQQSRRHKDAEFVPGQMWDALKNAELLRLNYGIFTLHMVLMAIFVVIPTALRNAGLPVGDEWRVYLPIFVGSMALAVPFIIIAEKKRKMKPVFIGAIAVILIAELGLSQFHQHLSAIIAWLALFFLGFNLLEATLPSLVSKTAPGDLKGTAMGAYSSSQFMGLFLGGVIGGWFNGVYGTTAVFAFCAGAVMTWLLVSWRMKPPRHVANMLISLAQINEPNRQFASALLDITGIEEIRISLEDAVAYLKVDNERLDLPALQALITHYETLCTTDDQSTPPH